MADKGWIGIDLDGTLAHYDGWKGAGHIGAPVPKMLAFVQGLIAKGETVKIFTARASEPDQVPAVKAWLKKAGLPELEVTNVKNHGMTALYDDRAFHVVKNTGRIVGALR